MTKLLYEMNHLTAQQVAEEMTRLLALPQFDSIALPTIYRMAVENLTRKESK